MWVRCARWNGFGLPPVRSSCNGGVKRGVRREILQLAHDAGSLETVETTLIELCPDNRTAFQGDENIHRTMRYIF
jgi:hypothetical protein